MYKPNTRLHEKCLAIHCLRMKKLLITGGSSYLGRHIVPIAQEAAYTYYSADPFAGGHQLDMRDGAAVTALVQQIAPDAIIHLAGSNRNADMANVIVAGCENVVQAAASVGAKVVFMSSDVIFDGTGAPYSEAAAPAPLHDYGRAKVRGEQIIASYSNHAIIRTSLIYSTRLMDRGTEWMQRAIAEQQPITLFTNQLRQPVHADDLSRACLALAKGAFTGVLNVAGREVVTRANFGRAILAHWGIPITETVTFAPDLSGRWPLDTRLDITLAQNVLSFPLRGVRDAITV